MSQRLVVRVRKEDTTIAALHYLWGADTITALDETQDLINCITDDTNEEKDILLRLIRFLESNGGGISGSKGSSEYEYIQSLYPNETFEEDGDPDDGVIALSEAGRDKLINLAEFDVTINLDKKTIENYVLAHYEDIEHLNETLKHWTNESNYRPFAIEDIPVLSVNPEEFGFDELKTLREELGNVEEAGLYDGELFGLIF